MVMMYQRKWEGSKAQTLKLHGPNNSLLVWQHAEDNSCRRCSPADSPEDAGGLLHVAMSQEPCNNQLHQNDSAKALSFVTFMSSYQTSLVTSCSVYSERTSLPLPAKPSGSTLALTVNLDCFQTGIVKCNKPPAITIPLQWCTSHKGVFFPSPHPFETQQPAEIHTG